MDNPSSTSTCASIPAPAPEQIDRLGNRSCRALSIWLIAIYVMVLVMIAVGGITRLTGSGLSMVEWRPLMGVFPPSNASEWRDVYEKYRQSPQFQRENNWMGIADFKRIFLWEYVHRLLGRVAGIVFIIPWLVFVFRRQMTFRLIWRMASIFVLGGLQGVLGWYMVKSGLSGDPWVSPYRLAAHLGLALCVLSWVFWLFLDCRAAMRRAISRPRRPHLADRVLCRMGYCLFALVFVQCLYGALMAGSRAGLLYPSFPLMNGAWLPVGLRFDEFITSPIMIHWVHRMLAWLVLTTITLFFIVGALGWRRGTCRQHISLIALLVIVFTQIILGAIVVLGRIQILPALLHQLTGALLLSATLYAAHAYRENCRLKAVGAVLSEMPV